MQIGPDCEVQGASPRRRSMVRHRGKSPDVGDTSLEAGGGGYLASFSKLSDALHGDALHRKPFHPTLLPLLGLLGTLQLWLAAGWGNPSGVVIGCCAVIVGLGLQLLQWGARTSAWADGRGCNVLKGFVALLGLLLLIRIASPDPFYDRIPESCALAKAQGCSRLSVVIPNVPNPNPPPDGKIAIQDVASMIERWAARRQGVTLLHRWPNVGSPNAMFMHLRAVSAFWGFADDVLLWVELREGHKGEYTRAGLVYILGQSQLRIGKSDFGVNEARLRSLLSDLLDDLAALSGNGDDVQKWRAEIYGLKGLRPIKAKIPENPLRH